MVPQTWSALIIQVKKGNSGDAVRGVQEEFQFRSGEPGKGLTVDGIFGPQTDSTVRGFQHALSLDIPSVTVDGIVGPVTWQAVGQRHVVGINTNKYVSCHALACLKCFDSSFSDRTKYSVDSEIVAARPEQKFKGPYRMSCRSVRLATGLVYWTWTGAAFLLRLRRTKILLSI